MACNPEDKALLSSDISAVKDAIGQLKEEYQNIIIWHYIDDLSLPEIAKIANKTEGTARVTLHRALKALKASIDSEQRTIKQS